MIATTLDVLGLLWAWTPALLKGFGLNILMGIVAMALATLFGVVLGGLQVSIGRRKSRSATLITQLLRGMPWLVVMFYVAWLLPFEFQIHDRWIQIPDWFKAAAGLSIPAAGYVSEIVRGGVRAIPTTQWEAASSLALNHRQSLRLVILPQTLRSMVAPWMNLYCAVTMSTSLANLLGVEELMTCLQLRLSSETRPDLLLPAYLYAFLAFFIYIYPISRCSKWLEQRWSLYS
jgi:His/Glu/Gln/Arg/opine family amino acid ABC transporter permease subunit